MEKNNIDKFKSLVSEEKSGWLEKALYRKENEDWLNISFDIAIKIMSTLSANKRQGNYPKNQKELAEAMDCTPQYITKLLKGTENLTIETISKIQKALNISLLNTKKPVIVKIVAKGEEEFNKTIPVPKVYQKTGKLIQVNFKVSTDQYDDYKKAD